jgi:hypothetical protein
MSASVIVGQFFSVGAFVLERALSKTASPVRARIARGVDSLPVLTPTPSVDSSISVVPLSRLAGRLFGFLGECLLCCVPFERGSDRLRAVAD